MDLYYRGILDKDHSWGVVATELCLALERRGFNLKMSDPIHKANWDPNRLDPRLESKMSENTESDLVLSYCVPPNLKGLPQGNIAQIYNYEYSVIPQGWSTLINNSVKLFLPSSVFARDVFVKNGVNPVITEVLHHGIDLQKYNPQIAPLNFNSNKFTFLCVSSPHYRKGLDLLLRAFGEEFATIEEVELIIKTQIPKKLAAHEIDIRKLLDEARKKVALPRVRIITDYMPNLAPLYRAAHAYVSTTHSECFGLTELEAVCCGLPVIAPNYGGYLDFLNQDNSFLVNWKPMYATREMQYWHYNPRSVCADPDIQHLRQQMRAVHNDYKLAQQKAKRAYEQTASKFTWDRIADRFIQLAESHKLIPPGRTFSRKEIPVGILIPKIQPSPNKAALGNEALVETVRESLRRKAMQTLPTSLTEKTDPSQIKLSSHTLLYNEENNVVSLLENIIDVFDEVVLVDGGSTDTTAKLVMDFIKEKNVNNVRFLVKPQKDSIRYSQRWNQSEQRNFAIQQCTGDWLFMIDADERLDSSCKQELRTLAASGRSKAYAFFKYNYWERKDQIRIDSWWFPNYSYKFWKNNEGIKYENKSRHCQPIVSHLGLPDVLGEKTVKNEKMFSDKMVHHLHYLQHSINELGFYRANEKDVRTIEELKKGLKTRPVPSLDKVLKTPNSSVIFIDRSSQEVRASNDYVGLLPQAPHAAFFMENFPFYSGGRYHLYQEAYTLAKAGVNVWLISNIIPVYVNDFPKLTNFRISDGWKIPSGIKFDLVVGTPSNCGERAKALADEHGSKLVLVSLETPNFIRISRQGTDSTEEYWSAYKRVLGKADIVLASAQLPAQYLKDWVNVPDKKIVLMPPAINEYALKKVGKIKKANTIVFVSRIVEHKHLDKLMIGIARIQKQMSDPPILDIIGQGSSEKVQKLLKETGVQGRFFTNISDVAKFQLIGRARALITCTSYEGFGMSPLEGAISEVPVLCSDLPIFHETIGERVTYFSLNNTTDLSNKLQAILTKPETFTTKIQDAHRWVESQYSLAAMTQRWKTVLQKLNLDKTSPAIQPAPIAKRIQPKVSVCIIALNEAEYITHTLRQIYDWDCCHEIIIVEGSVSLYPKENLSKEGLSGDGTTALIQAFPDPKNKITYVNGVFSDKIAQRNEYAKRVTGTHVLVLDADEFYTHESLDLLKEDIQNNPDAELFTFNFSSDLTKRTYYHLWYSFKDHVIGGYWNIPHNRIYKWTPGTKYTGEDHNHPTKPDGTKLQAQFIRAVETRAICIHTGFAKSIVNQKDKNIFYVSRGEGKEKDPKIRARRQMYVDCRKAYETWKPGMVLPHDSKVLSFSLALPEALLDHPYMNDPNCIRNERDRK